MGRSLLVVWMEVAAAALVAVGCGDEAPHQAVPPSDAGVDAPPAFDGTVPAEPAMPCAPGEVILRGGGCRAAGVPETDCGEGFEPTGDGGCDAVLPEEPCAPGTLAFLGETQCHPVAPCGAGPFGDVPVDATTQYVDASYTAADADGSASKPWPTVQAGIDAAVPSAIVAVAKGTYNERAVVQGKAVRLWGACPSETGLVAPAGGSAVDIRDGATGTEVHDLGITGEEVGIAVQAATDVWVDRVWIHDTKKLGAMAQDFGGPAALRLTGTLVEHTGGLGVFAWGSPIEMDQTVIRDVQPLDDGTFGRGIGISADPDTGARTSLDMKRSIVERCRAFGLIAFRADVLIEDSLFRDTLPQASDGRFGYGLNLLSDNEGGVLGTAVIRRSIIERSRVGGLNAQGSDLEIEDTVVRDVEPDSLDDTGGICVETYVADVPQALRTTVRIESSVFERCRTAGLGAEGDTTITGLVVRDVDSQRSSGTFGRGIGIQADAHGEPGRAELFGVVVERTREGGLLVIGSEVSVDSIAVRDVQPQGDGIEGRGIFGLFGSDPRPRPKIDISNALVERVVELGLGVIGGELLADAVIVRDVASRAADGRAGYGIVIVRAEENIDASGSVRHAFVEGAREGGVLVVGATASLDDVTVVDTQASSGGFGDGIIASTKSMAASSVPTNLTIHGSHVHGSARAGITTFGSTVSLADTVLACNAIQLDGEPMAQTFELVDDGGNTCGCESTIEPCKVLSSGLEPPTAIDP